MFVTVGSAIAIAQPSTVTPITPAPEEPAPYVYPRRTVDRPLLLPDGGLDVAMGFHILNDNTSYFIPDARVAISTVELRVGVALQLGDRPDPDTTLAAFTIGGMRELVPCRVPGLAVGAQFAGYRLTGDSPRIAPSLLAEYKRKLASFFAILPTASLGYDYIQASSEDEVGNVIEGSYHQLEGSLALRAQLQISDGTLFEALFGTAYFQDLGDYPDVGVSSHSQQTIGGALVLTTSGNTDFRFSYIQSRHSWAYKSDGIFLGLAFRRI